MNSQSKQKDYSTVVSAIVKFIEEADRAAAGPAPQNERNDLIENSK